MSESADSLVEEILEDARRQAERAKEKARREAEKRVQKAREQAEAEKQKILAEADERAESEVNRVRASISQEKRFLRQRALHKILEHVRSRCMDRLRELPEESGYLDILVTLALDGISQMAGNTFSLVLPEGQRQEHGEKLAEKLPERVEQELNRRVSVDLSEDTTDASGGLVIIGMGGKEICDETFEARMERLWPHLRNRIGELIRDSEVWSSRVEEAADAAPAPSDEQESEQDSE